MAKRFCLSCQYGQCRRCEGDDPERCCCGKVSGRAPSDLGNVIDALHEGFVEAATSGTRIPAPARLAELKRMPYRQYLQTPEWRERRTQRLRMALERCRWCGFDPPRPAAASADGRLPFNLHHLTYERLGMEAWDDLVLLCTTCHRKAHGLDTKGEPVAEEAIA